MPLKKKTQNTVNRMTDKEILSAVRSQIESCGKKITNTQGLFILEIIDYAIQKGVVTKDGLLIFLTEDDMVSLFGVSKSFVIKTIALFTSTGIFDRSFSPVLAKELYGDGRMKTKPTTISKKFYEH